MKQLNPVVEILMNRDNLSLEEAIECVVDCAEAMLEAIEDGEDPEEVIMEELSLEPDYVFYVMAILED